MDKFKLFRLSMLSKEFPLIGEGVEIAPEINIIIPMLNASFKAKVDTGNDGYNVIHADQCEIDGSTVYFKIGGKVYTLPLHETINVQKGKDVETRPVVQFPLIEMEGQGEIENVLFSLADRSTYDEPILIGKEFLKGIKAEIKF